MRMRPLLGLTALALVVSGCAADDRPSPGDASPTLDTSVSPLTGLHQGSPPKNAAIMVKIENTSSGQPQYGVDQADFVVEQLVEGGATRLAAFFYSSLPAKVGHVRSARTMDVDLAEPIDATILASGGAPKTLRKIERSDLPYYSYDQRSPGWSSDPSKPAPYHVLWDLTELGETAKAAVPPKPYFAWGAGPSVLLVHGWEGRGAQLGALVDPLVAAGYRVVALDGPAHGDSPGRLSTLALPAHAV